MSDRFTVPEIPPPQMVPGGQFTDPFLDDFRRELQDVVGDIYENLNILAVDISVTGQGGVPTYVVGHSDYGTTAGTPPAHQQLIGGATCILVTETDKQIIVGFWYLSDSSTNEYTVALVKSMYPYKVWSNLAGTSKTPTTIVYTGSATHNSGNPSLCENASGDILVGYYDTNASAPKVARYVRDGLHWEYSATTTLATTYSFDNATLGEIIASEDAGGNEILLYGRVDNRGGVESAHIYKQEAGSWGTGPVGTWTRYYDPSSTSCVTLGALAGEDCRLIKMDGDYVLALWPWRGNSTDLRYTLLYAISEDGGETWPTGACSGTDYAVGYPDNASGSIFPLNGGTPPVSQANMVGPGTGSASVVGRTWDAAYLPGTTKVGIVLWGDAVSGHVHNQRAGLRYLEFDRTYNSETGGADSLSEWVTITRQVPIVSAMLSCSDGTPRVVWGQGVSTSALDGALCLMFSEVIPGANPLNPLAWTTPKQVINFSDSFSVGEQIKHYQFTAPVTGVFEDAAGLVIWPILACRYNLDATALGSPSSQAVLFLLAIEQLEDVEELEETESLLSLDDLIAYWILGEASGTTRYDSHGDNHLTDVNTVSQAGGKIDRSAETDGAADFLSIADNTDLSLAGLNGGFTVVGWIYPTVLGNRGGIIGKGWNDGTNQEWTLQHNASLQLLFYISYDGTSANSITSTDTCNQNDWNFFALRYNSSAQTMEIRIGGGSWKSAANTNGVFDSTSTFRIGRDSGGATYFPGRLCDVSFWKRPLTDAEVTILYNDGDGLRYPFTG